MGRSSNVPYRFLAPYIAIFGVFWAGPILYSLWLSFVNTRAYPWALQPAVNWSRLPHDTFFWTALWNTLAILMMQVPLMLVLAVLLALALNSSMLRARAIRSSMIQSCTVRPVRCRTTVVRWPGVNPTSSATSRSWVCCRS